MSIRHALQLTISEKKKLHTELLARPPVTMGMAKSKSHHVTQESANEMQDVKAEEGWCIIVTR